MVMMNSISGGVTSAPASLPPWAVAIIGIVAACVVIIGIGTAIMCRRQQCNNGNEPPMVSAASPSFAGVEMRSMRGDSNADGGYVTLPSKSKDIHGNYGFISTAGSTASSDQPSSDGYGTLALSVDAAK